jgi:signal transduction histidine kinase
VVSATPSPSAEAVAARRIRLPRRLRRLLPRTFQARLTIAFVGVIALVLILVSVFVLNRLDDYFARQQTADLESRSATVATFVRAIAEGAIPDNQVVVGSDGRLNPTVAAAMTDPSFQHILADQFALANVTVRFGGFTNDGGTVTFHPTPDDPFEARLRAAAPAAGQTQESTTVGPSLYFGGDVFGQYAVEITLGNPYTFRHEAITNVTGILLAIGLFALGLSVLVSAALARRFTTPLRQLTDTARSLADGDLSQRVVAGKMRAGSSELVELAVQFNAMADRVEESVELIRRDRDRSRDFLADVSHELRTPLAALRTFNDLLKERAGGDPEARSEFLESSGQQIERLDWLAQNLLELSKLDSGLVLLDLRPEDLRAAVETAVEQSAAAARKRGITVRLTLPNSPVRIRHDPQRIGQVVANLVNNALKFTGREGSVTVDVAATADGARIDVADTGVGIDPAELPHIFERFYRGSRANEARGSGSGLGLAIVQSIVDMHGGSISVQTHVGTGSRFTVLLPRDPRLIEGTPAAARADVASASDAPTAQAEGVSTDGKVRPEPARNMTETSPTDRPQVNPEPAP